MIPPKYVEELKNAPASIADFPATFVEVHLMTPWQDLSDFVQMFEGQITTIGTEQSLHPRIIKNQLNHHLRRCRLRVRWFQLIRTSGGSS